MLSKQDANSTVVLPNVPKQSMDLKSKLADQSPGKQDYVKSLLKGNSLYMRQVQTSPKLFKKAGLKIEGSRLGNQSA